MTKHVDQTTVRDAARRRETLGGTDAEALEYALTITERERDAERTAHAETKAQLPAGMEHCTILFRECEKGHGWLTANNWAAFDCPTCALARVTQERDEARREIGWPDAIEARDLAETRLEEAREQVRVLSRERDEWRSQALGMPGGPKLIKLADERDEALADAVRWKVSQEAAVEIGGACRREANDFEDRYVELLYECTQKLGVNVNPDFDLRDRISDALTRVSKLAEVVRGLFDGPRAKE